MVGIRVKHLDSQYKIASRPQGSNRLAGPSILEAPSPPRPIPRRWLVPDPPSGRDRPMRNAALRGSQFRAPIPTAAARHAGRWFKTSFKKKAGQRRALRPPPAPIPARYRRSRPGGQFIRPTCPRAPSFAGRWSVWSRVVLLHLSQCLPPPRVSKNERSPPSAPARPARFSAQGSRAAVSSAPCAP